jgi:circadian clock protein KaiB
MEKYKFKLYIVDNTATSIELVDKLTNIFNNALNENFELEVVDIIKHPELAIKDKILATPTLILELPLPKKRIVGNIGNSNTIMIGLDLLNK